MKLLPVACLVVCVGLAALSDSLRAEVVVADDFFYNQPTKPIGPGGGFALQDYGGGQNGPAGTWTGRWVSSGNGIITGPDFEETDNQFLGLTAGGLTPVTANFLQRGYALRNVAPDQTLYFGVRARTEVDGMGNSRMWINAPLNEDSQIAMGFDDFGFIAELGLDFDFSLDEETNDGEFHSLVGKLEVNAVGDQERLTVWLDPTGVEQGSQLSVESNVIDDLTELSGPLQLGRAGEGSIVYWDDVAVGTSWEDVVSVDVPRLEMQIDPASGQTRLVNSTETAFPLNFYEMQSPSGSLDVATWNSLDDQGTDGDGWRENAPNANRLTESFFLGDTTLSPGNLLDLGKPFKPGGQRDLVARFGTSEGLLNLAMVQYVSGPNGDFNGNGQLDAEDIDLLSLAVLNAGDVATFDLSGDGRLDQADRTVWVEDLANTYFGDSNLDGVFDTADFLLVFQAGQFEDGVPQNSTWATGDWSGDREFDTADFLLAFQAGGFEQGPRGAVSAVPEPGFGLASLFAGMLLLRVGRRRTLGSPRR